MNSVEVSPGVWAMASGDPNCDGEVDLTDKQLWETEAGLSGYIDSDLNMDREVDNKDKLQYWLKNDYLNCHVPD